MHQLRYHPSSSAPSTLPPAPGPPGVDAPVPRPEGGRSRRSSAIAPLALAVIALISGGAYAVIRPQADAPPTQAELQAAAHRAVLTSADLPAGWTANPPHPVDNGGAEDDRALAECMGATYEDSSIEAESSFSSGALSAASNFKIASSVEQARGDFAALAVPAAAGCFEQMARKELDADKPVNGTYDLKVTSSGLAAGLPKDTDRDAIGIRVTATLHQDKATVPIVIDTIMLRYDRIEATLAFTSVGDPAFPTDLARTLTNAVVQRLPDPA